MKDVIFASFQRCPAFALRLRLPISGARFGARQDAAQAEAVDHSACHAAHAAGRRHALLVDRRQQPGARLRRLAGGKAGRGLERTAWYADTRRLAAGSNADCSRDVARARRPRQSRQTGMERGPAGAARRAWRGQDGWKSRPRAGNGFAWPGPRRCPSPPTDCASCCRCARNRGRRFADVIADNLHADTPIGGDASVRVPAPASGLQTGGAIR